MSDLYRVYSGDELGRDGYPPVWHQTLKHEVRERAGHRCIRCGHPYQRGEHPLVSETGDEGRTVYVSWSPCDERCRHGGPVRWSNGSSWEKYDGPDETIARYVQARWRILTVHHLDMDKANCRWWNLVALCQRCHLEVQLTVRISRPYLLEHSDWFKPYVAGFYAWRFLREDLSREEVEARLDELLALEHRQLVIAGAASSEDMSPNKETEQSAFS